MKTAQSVLSIEGLKVAENRRNSTHPCATHIPITFISVNCLGRASKCFSKNYRLFFFFSGQFLLLLSGCQCLSPTPSAPSQLRRLSPTLSPPCPHSVTASAKKVTQDFFSLSEVIEKFLNEASTLTEIDFTTLRLGAEKE